MSVATRTLFRAWRPGLPWYAMVFVCAVAICALAFFHPSVPLWAAGLPLLAAIVLGTRSARQLGMAAYLLIPAFNCAWGFTGLGWPHVPVWLGAVLITGGLAVLAGRVGIVPVSILTALVPPFPASPLLVLADALPFAGVVGLGTCVVSLGAAELAKSLGKGAIDGLASWLERRLPLVGAAVLGAFVVHAMTHSPAERDQGAWVEVPVPLAISERTGWIRIRDSLAPGAVAVFGESMFEADDRSAIAFWCRAAIDRDLTLYIGVKEPRGEAHRGAIWRFDPGTCAPTSMPAPVYRATFGVPGVTGTWGAMATAGQPERAASDPIGPNALICLEAFLVRAWLPHFTSPTQSDQPIIVLAHDGAFGALPVWTLRRKVADAMAGLVGRDVAHADTGRVFLRHSVQTGDPS